MRRSLLLATATIASFAAPAVGQVPRDPSPHFFVSAGLAREGHPAHYMGSHLSLGYAFTASRLLSLRGEGVLSSTRTNEPAALLTATSQPSWLGPVRATASVGTEMFGRRWFFDNHSVILGAGVEVGLPFSDGLFLGLRHLSSDGGVTLFSLGTSF